MNEEFYIGWESKAPKGVGRSVLKMIIALLSLTLLLAIALAVSQRLIGASVFEWDKQRTFSGFLLVQPYPHLLVPRPGRIGSQTSYSTYYLIAQWKFGLDQKAIAPLDGKRVTVKGALIYRENETAIETKPEWIETNAALPDFNLASQSVKLGRQTVRGEIVDSKCFFGVMNPGQLTPHRACAIRCISGGVPPVLLVHQRDGQVVYFMLVSANGEAVNQHVLDLVAEPVEITGEIERQGDLFILRADPATYRRL